MKHTVVETYDIAPKCKRLPDPGDLVELLCMDGSKKLYSVHTLDGTPCVQCEHCDFGDIDTLCMSSMAGFECRGARHFKRVTTVMEEL